MTPQELAIKAQELQDMYNAGQFTESEFKELVNDLIVQESINNAAMELEENITYRNIIVGVINVASAI
jgi:polyhydroxyalkanoate synthesis regulator phasin